MGVPLRMKVVVGAYVVKQRLMGREKYPLVMMLEPLLPAIWSVPAAARSSIQRIF